MKKIIIITLISVFAVGLIHGPAMAKTDEELLDETEAKAALYFYNEALSNGFVKDSNYSDFASVGATGFGLASLCVMAERYQTTPNWTINPTQARARVNLILDNCINAQNSQTHKGNKYGIAGFLYHFIDSNGIRYEKSEVSTIDMALFLSGAIVAGEYFGGEIKEKVAKIYNNLNWPYFLSTKKKQFSHGWYPESGLFPQTWDRPSDETILITLLALGSDPDNRDFLETMYSWPRTVKEYAGYKIVNSYFGSLFTYVYAHCFFDFEKLGNDNPSSVKSSVISVSWWDNSVNAVYANRQFCIDNSSTYPTYGPDSWGITACKYASGVSYAGSYGAAPCENSNGVPYHTGTIAPYGAISSMPLMRTSPDEKLGENLAFKALKYYYTNHYNALWGDYGLCDSFNHNSKFHGYYLGIDLGPEVLMIENYRSRLIWDNFMKNRKIKAALSKVF